MMEVYGNRFTAWAPGLDSREAWEQWERDSATAVPGTVPMAGASPALDFAEPRWKDMSAEEMKNFKRRLSQVSKMTIQVIHEIMPVNQNTRMVFLSFRGEIGRQYKINKSIIEDREILPAAFSLSVFNTPPAAASIALGLRAGYTALYPGKNRFDTGVLAAAAPLLDNKAEEILLVYADEQIPAEYSGLDKGASPTPALALALILSTRKTPGSLSVPAGNDFSGMMKTPEDFLRSLIRSGVPWGSETNERS